MLRKSVEFTADSRRLMAVTQQAVHVWDLPYSELIQRARLNTGRESTRDEIREYFLPATSRQAAAAILRIGGRLSARDGDEIREVASTQDLPGGEVQVVGAEVDSQVTDDVLKSIGTLTGLQHLSLRVPSKVTDSGLEHLGGLSELK